DTIEAAIAAAPDPVDAAYVGGLGVSAVGMPALEYLLWGEDPAAVLADLSDPSLGKARCGFARALADDLATRAAAARAGWDPGFAAAVATAGHGSAIYDSVQPALDDLVNHEIDALQTIVKAKLDTPLGNLSGAAADPTLAESRFADAALADLTASLSGVWAV